MMWLQELQLKMPKPLQKGWKHTCTRFYITAIWQPAIIQLSTETEVISHTFTHWKNKNKQSWEVVTTRCLWGSINRWIKKVAVFWVAWKEGGLPFDPQLRERRQPAAKRRLTQKLRVRSYHHPDDIGACLLPSDINPLGQCYWDV